ncbi:hypothetical protein [Sphingomonas sp.]|uniref:hypothetical protein n=1 Tax=Sphingomonas sp. TaxID=28214 RepID=UPI00286B243D|nr:hypothetical protein [Sphingomonas sp.]
MKIYGFASDSLTNIWAGIGAQRWAVGQSNDGAYAKGRLTKAAKMSIGSFGILYCSETSAYTTPFVVYSRPNPSETITNIWASPWVLPFGIKPLGNPDRSLSIRDILTVIPNAAGRGISDPRKHLITVQGNFAFQASEITDEDWAILIEHLAI